MILYHFTSYRHLRAIAQFGLTVGDVPTDIVRNKGHCGVWLTTSAAFEGHGLTGSKHDKRQYRLTVDVPETGELVKWTDWAKRNATPTTIAALHGTAPGFETWYVFFGVLPRPTILQCCHMFAAETAVADWDKREPTPFDVEPVAPDHRARWHKRLLKQMAREIERARRGGNPVAIS